LDATVVRIEEFSSGYRGVIVELNSAAAISLGFAIGDIKWRNITLESDGQWRVQDLWKGTNGSSRHDMYMRIDENDPDVMYIVSVEGEGRISDRQRWVRIDWTEKPSGGENQGEPSAQPDVDVEGEILRIRAIWQADREAMANDLYATVTIAPGVVAYTDRGRVKMIEAERDAGGVPFMRIYQYEDGNLIFAYLEADDAHRLYFKDDRLFRWRYAPDARDIDRDTIYDSYADSPDFAVWEDFALYEGYALYEEATR